ncbi:DUF1844 domain-containing protein [candidate division KSB1 bacterium]|nr:DUF1844 domain-containing protein [candidate division KSB1 bacterium]
MTTQYTPEQMHSALFLNLVISLQAAAYQQMGKMKNPATDKVEKDMDQAQMSIDMIAMLKAKTQGNLSKEEGEFISQVLRELQMNYVAESNKEQSAQSKSDAGKSEQNDSKQDAQS